MIFTWAVHLLIGCGLGLCGNLILLVPLAGALWLSARKLQGAAWLCAGLILGLICSTKPVDLPLKGKGIFTLDAIAPAHSPFHRGVALRGKLTTFKAEKTSLKHLPCVIFVKQPPPVSKHYFVEGTLEGGHLRLQKNAIQAIGKGGVLVHLRYLCKERVRAWCHRLPDKKVGHFFASILTGDTDDRLLAMEFRKWGLSHVLAISGFHFTLLSLGFNLLFRAILPSSVKEIALIGALTVAYAYFGPTASITRAYLMISLFLIGQKLLQPAEPLNLLGAALLIELITHPHHVADISFQLSYAATFGILVFFGPIERLLQWIFPKRYQADLMQMSFLDKHGYLASAFVRNGLALSIAIHLSTLPLLLYHFHSFPICSPLFNLFLPPLLALCILTIPLGPLNISFTRGTLRVISHAPEQFNLSCHTPDFPFEVVLLLMSAIGILGLTLTRNIGHSGVLFRPWRS